MAVKTVTPLTDAVDATAPWLDGDLPSDVGTPGAHQVIDAGVCGRRPINDELLDPEDQSPMDATGLMLTGDGNWYEDWLDDRWQENASHITYVRIRDNEYDASGERDLAVLDQRVDDTVAALTDAITQTSTTTDVVVVFNGRLKFPGFSGEADAWLVEDGKIYPVDVKHSKNFEKRKQITEVPTSTLARPSLIDAEHREYAGTLKSAYDLQLVHYYYQAAILSQQLGVDAVPAEPWGAIIPKPIEGEPVLLWRRLDEPRYKHPNPDEAADPKALLDAIELHAWHYRRWVELTLAARAHRDALEGEGDSVGLPVAPEKQTDCGSCRWRDACMEVIEFRQDATLTQGVGPAQTQVMRPHVNSIYDLSMLCEKTAAAIDAGVNVPAATAAAMDAAPNMPVEDLLRLSEAKRQTLANVGVVSAADVAAFDPWTMQVGKPPRKKLVTLIDQARAQAEDRVFTQRGVDPSTLLVPGCSAPTKRSLGEPPCEVHYDLEALVGGDDSPHPLACDHIYLHGLLVKYARRRAPKHSGFRAIYNDTTVISDEHERQVFVEFWKTWSNLVAASKRAKVGRVVLYHYSSYENTVLNRLTEKFAGMPGVPDEDEFARLWTDYQHRHDLYEFVRDQLVLPTKSLSLKDTASAIGRHFWRADDPSGSNSIAWQRSVFSGELDRAAREKLQRTVVEYNEDDVRGQLALRERLHWLLTLAPHKVHPISHVDEKYARRRRYVQRAA